MADIQPNILYHSNDHLSSMYMVFFSSTGPAISITFPY